MVAIWFLRNDGSETLGTITDANIGYPGGGGGRLVLEESLGRNLRPFLVPDVETLEEIKTELRPAVAAVVSYINHRIVVELPMIKWEADFK